MLACLYTSFIEDVRSRRRLFFKKGHLTDKFDDRVGHLNTILARGGGNLKDPIFKSSNARLLPGGGGCWSFELIGALTAAQTQEFCHLFWLKYRQEHSAKRAIISYVQEIKLRWNSLVARICHLVNIAKCSKHCGSNTKLIWVDWRSLCGVKWNTKKKGLPEWNQ